MLQTILLILGVIIGVILLLGLVIKKDFVLSSEATINRPKDQVFDFVKLIRNQEKYSKWVMTDPHVKLVYTGTDGTVGFKSAWESADKSVGVGEQEITEIVPGEKYSVEIRFEKPFKGTSYATTATTALSEQQTRVVTTFNSHSPFPMNKMSALFMGALKKDMDQNSANLKKVLELS